MLLVRRAGDVADFAGVIRQIEQLVGQTAMPDIFEPVHFDHPPIGCFHPITERLMHRDDVPAIFEGTFHHAGVTVRTDVLVRDDHCWQLVEVKAGTRCKAVHDIDLAIQLWVLDGAGVELTGEVTPIRGVPNMGQVM